jgi:seryl-tRNA synthetase
VLENYQREDGIEVPEVLRKYIPGQPEFLPYVKELPKDSTSLKAKVCDLSTAYSPTQY